MRGMILSVLGALMFLTTCLVGAEETRVLRNPDISGDKVAFVYAQDIWVASCRGGDARRLTTFPGRESDPCFSPDGKWIAFSGEYDGNRDVYLIPAEGGEPRRLTWHPGMDMARGWTPAGDKVVFASNRDAAPNAGIVKFWTIGIHDAMPVPLPIPRISEGKFSPDGKRMAYRMVLPWETEWRNYRGGQNNPVRVIDLQSLAVTKLPWEGSNDQRPVWIGDTVYFLSDRDFCMNVWSCHLPSGRLNQETSFKEFDCKNLESDDSRLIFENGGWLYLLEPGKDSPRRLSINVRGDFPWARPHWENVGALITAAAVSPSGKRALFEARGEIFSVPAEKGEICNISRNSGAADRSPAWSPDGSKISWFSDQGGEYRLVIADQQGAHRRIIDLRNPTFYYTPVWSPDGKWLSFGDADRNLWLMNVAEGSATLVDNAGTAHPERTIYPEWSSDSSWIAYTKRLGNEFNAIFVYSLDQKKSFRITDGMADCREPAWDKNGKYLYFLASTNYALNVGWLDMSSMERPVRRAVYAAALAADTPWPLLPESDEEAVPSAQKSEKKKDEKSKADTAKRKVVIDFSGLTERIKPLDLPLRHYGNLQAGAEGTFYFIENQEHSPGGVLKAYSLQKRKTETILSGVLAYRISRDGKKLLYLQPGRKWGLAPAGAAIKPGTGLVKTAAMRMKVDPAAEWKQIFREAWRFQRDYFYVANVHGLDMDWAFRAYAPWVEHVRHREDLTYILDILGGETAVGHSFTGGGDTPDVERVPIGLLGADYVVEKRRYRIQKIYDGESWNPGLQSPLGAPGVAVNEDDYLLAVNGVELDASRNLYSLFDGLAGRQTRITVNASPDMAGARTVTVIPVANELRLRRNAWIENNRKRVDELSNGKLAYVWVPDTGSGGYTQFNRYYFAQKDRKGAVIDERFNTGGSVADYIVDLMARDLMGYFNNPVDNQRPFPTPNAALYGPKVMVINEMCGSGGDMLPFMFRKRKIGPLVGTRTWGGLVGIWDVPALIDGGYITAPRGGFINTRGEWDVENKGIAPDIEVEQDPAALARGEDPQLEAAVRTALKLLEKGEYSVPPQPADPVRVKRPK